ncbi:MAG: 3',5'-cyclic-AMP phosphodiesterase [SAR86 cluster bacterium]|uniref:3',5'-cyclic-AMP phosphodiesterase n=1 Tax=SAR86 cluster bacterium TaxID=2030880 RepID=A0A2A5CI12_9GAMM|nr:MAG: 3',5'-cyclic-AMP phosphodiesterase [SAR86 cluster bacterium]
MDKSLPKTNITESYRVIQITDSHLFADESMALVGMNCQEGLEDVIELVKEHEEAIDCILCTGDIAQDASQAAYNRFAAQINTLDAPQLWIPGNHDIIASMEQALSNKKEALEKTLRLGNWGIIMLNSCVEGHIYGMLSEQELEHLRTELEVMQSEGLYVLVAIHHNPVPVNAEWLQNHSLQNTDGFFDIIDGYQNIRAVVFGHIHQDFKISRNKVLMLGAPSTSIQFHPEHDYFSLDKENPGYRWLSLHGDGTVGTGVRRVVGKKYKLDLSSKGY